MSSTSPSPSPVVAAMELQPAGDGAFTAWSVPAPEGHEGHRSVVFGGQLLGQIVMAASARIPAKRVATLHAVFSRPADTALPLDIEAAVVQDGRSLGSVAVTVRQGGKTACSALVTLDAGDDDLIRHASPAPAVGAPEAAPEAGFGEPGSELRMVGGVDFTATEATGPAESQAWARFDDAPPDGPIAQALLAWYTDMFLVGTTMRPHDGIGMGAAHRTVSTGVITHSLVFHEEWDPSRWFLVSQESRYAGRGRYYGTGAIHGEDGSLVASFSQSGIVRAMPEQASAGRDGRSAM